MNRKIIKLLLLWAFLLLLSITVFNFIHECGHGFGAQLDGRHISTGFNQVGDPGKKPNDPNFRSQQIETGMLDSSGILGPFTNWMFATLFTALLFGRSKDNFATMTIGAVAVSNSLNRLFGLLPFFIGALHNKVRMADEVEWGLKAIQGLDFPMSMSKFTAIAEAQPALLLSNYRVYFWPMFSIVLSCICLFLVYKKLYYLFGVQLKSKTSRWIFGLMPIIVGIVAFIGVSVLDKLIRINW